MTSQSYPNLCIHTMTNKPWDLKTAVQKYQDRGIGGISVWQNVVEPIGVAEASLILNASDLEVVSYVRGGFFPAASRHDREKAIAHNLGMIEESAQLGAPVLVLVCGAEPTVSKQANEDQICAGIEAILESAAAHQVVLGIEPLHPMYADTRSAINTLGQANRIAARFASPWVKVVFDVYHLWWDPNLEEEIEISFKTDVFGTYHICDWKVPTTDFLTDRGIMGEGCIDLEQIDQLIMAQGFDGYREVEIFSEAYWKQDQDEYLDRILNAYQVLY